MEGGKEARARGGRQGKAPLLAKDARNGAPAPTTLLLHNLRTIAARYNRRDEEADLVGLPGPGRVPVSDSEVFALQRAGGAGGGRGTGAVSTDAGHQGDTGGSAATNPGVGKSDAHSASQRGGVD